MPVREQVPQQPTKADPYDSYSYSASLSRRLRNPGGFRSGTSGESPLRMNQLIQVGDYELIDPAYYHEQALRGNVLVMASQIGDIIKQRVPLDSQEEKGSPILDVAAGTGVVSGHLSDMGYEMTATDVSPRALRYLKDHHPEITTKTADMNEKLPFDDNTFRGAATLWANRFVKGDIMPREVYRVLAPGGVFIWPIDSQAEGAIWKKLAGTDQPTQPEELLKILESIGFSVDEVKAPEDDRFKNSRTIYPDIYLVASKPE